MTILICSITYLAPTQEFTKIHAYVAKDHPCTIHYLQHVGNDERNIRGKTNVPSDRAEAKLNALSQAVRAITMEVGLERILPRLAEITAHLINARYAALGVPNNEGGMEQFFTYGMTERQISHMDHYPLGLGLLGLLLKQPEPI